MGASKYFSSLYLVSCISYLRVAREFDEYVFEIDGLGREVRDLGAVGAQRVHDVENRVIAYELEFEAVTFLASQPARQGSGSAVTGTRVVTHSRRLRPMPRASSACLSSSATSSP